LVAHATHVSRTATAANIAVRPAPQVAEGHVVQSQRLSMGTTLAISVWAAPGREAAAASAIQHALDEVARLEALISSWRADSQTSAINQAAGGRAVTIGPELHELLVQSVDWSRRTRGAFDVTGGPLFELWSEARAAKQLPEKSSIDARRLLVGYQHIELGENTARLARPGMRLGFGAIGKGFAADRVSAYLHDSGFADHIVDAGGDLVIAGRRGDKPWTIGVRHPQRSSMIALLELSDCAVATSGDYEQYLEVDGRRYSHIIDPRNGWPVERFASVTVIAPRGVAADALATALSVLPADEGIELVRRISATEAMLIDAKGAVRLTPGLRFDGETLVRVR
jgi:thiamine biosynthesis lipoprotein